MQDQSDFLKFLQQITGAPVSQPEPVEAVQADENSHEVDAIISNDEVVIVDNARHIVHICWSFEVFATSVSCM